MSELINLIIKTADKLDEAGLEDEANALDFIVEKIMITDDGREKKSRGGG